MSYAIAVGGVKSIALIGRSHCGMVNLVARRELFTQGLVDNAGWERERAEEHFNHFTPMFEIGNEIDFRGYRKQLFSPRRTRRKADTKKSIPLRVVFLRVTSWKSFIPNNVFCVERSQTIVPEVSQNTGGPHVVSG